MFQWLSGLAPNKPPQLTNTHTLLSRLSSSQELEDIRDLVNAPTATEWHYFVVAGEDYVCQMYLPDLFHCSSSGTYVLPLVIMDCELALLMDPDPMSKAIPVKSPDVHMQCSLAAVSQPSADLREGLEALVSSASTAHVHCYLDVVQMGLKSGLAVSPQDYHYGLSVCTLALLATDLTPLLAVFCPHTTMPEHAPPPLDTPTLASLLEIVVSRQRWSVKIRPAESDESACHGWVNDKRCAINKVLSDSGFVPVPNCSGYFYWMVESHEKKVKILKNCLKFYYQ